ncbi:MAG: amino acid permease, partial [Rhodobacteraceae bacterium]|nr:amino acid permease [Paracoccaceae bacterium]
MLALSLGIAAAFAWAAHDLLVRKLSQGAVLLPMMLAVLAAGGVALLLPALLLAEWSAVGVAGLMAFNVGLYLTFAYTMLEAANAITAGYLISVVATMTGYEGAL